MNIYERSSVRKALLPATIVLVACIHLQHILVQKEAQIGYRFKMIDLLAGKIDVAAVSIMRSIRYTASVTRSEQRYATPPGALLV